MDKALQSAFHASLRLQKASPSRCAALCRLVFTEAAVTLRRATISKLTFTAAAQEEIPSVAVAREMQPWFFVSTCPDDCSNAPFRRPRYRGGSADRGGIVAASERYMYTCT